MFRLRSARPCSDWEASVDEAWLAQDAERLVAGDADAIERSTEAALRPMNLEEFVGQESVRNQLSLVLRAAAARGNAAS